MGNLTSGRYNQTLARSSAPPSNRFILASFPLHIAFATVVKLAFTNREIQEQSLDSKIRLVASSPRVPCMRMTSCHPPLVEQRVVTLEHTRKRPPQIAPFRTKRSLTKKGQKYTPWSIQLRGFASRIVKPQYCNLAHGCNHSKEHATPQIVHRIDRPRSSISNEARVCSVRTWIPEHVLGR